MTAPNPPYQYGAQTAPINLASDTRAQQNTVLAALSSTVRASLLSASSRQIERICKRVFGLTDYQVYCSGGGQPYDLIMLGNYPVSQITRLATRPLPVLTITNTGATAQRATIATTTTGVTVVTVASGVATTTTLAYATYPTLSALATAITAIGGGMGCSVSGGYELFPSADLKPLQGAASCLQGGARLELYTEDISCWAGGWFDGGSSWGMVADGPGWRLDTDTGMIVGRFPRGMLNIRVDYSAGYATSPDALPDDLQEACVQHAKDLYRSGRVDLTSAGEKIGPYQSTSKQNIPPMSTVVMSLISSYIDRSKTISMIGPAL